MSGVATTETTISTRDRQGKNRYYDATTTTRMTTIHNHSNTKISTAVTVAAVASNLLLWTVIPVEALVRRPSLAVSLSVVEGRSVRSLQDNNDNSNDDNNNSETHVHDNDSKYFLGIPNVLWVLAWIGVAVACLLLFGRRKIPDFSEAEPLIVPVQQVVVEPETETAPPLLLQQEPKVDYEATTSTEQQPQQKQKPSSGPAFGRQGTNPAGLVARPQYNPTGITKWIFGKEATTS